MVFSSTTFICLFLPIVFLIYTAIPSLKAKNYFLLAASMVFYVFGEPASVLVMIISITVNYAAGRLMTAEKHRRTFLAACVLFDIGLLFVYKYLGFVLSFAGVEFSPKLPLGISFFTFQALSYVIDCYRDKSLVRKNILELALYISFFPQLIAGPIVRYGDISAQMENRTHTAQKTAEGIKRFCFGLGKKMLIANTAARAADYVFSYETSNLTAFAAWLGAICYALQIYYDFSAYSDMAIGLGKMFGFDFRENFNYPYSADSVTEFWHRWHISLSSWFRDYLYIPLGGNRKSKVRTIINKWIVFICTGIWHGANLTFLVWGIIHGAVLTLENLTFKKGEKLHFQLLRRVFTLIVIIISFVIFRADSLSYGISFIGRMFTKGGNASVNAGLLIMATPLFLTEIGVGIVFAAPVLRFAAEKAVKINPDLSEYISYFLAVTVLILSLLTLSEGGYNPFIYFRF